MKVGHQKDFSVMRALEPSAPPPILQRGAGDGVNDGRYVCVMKPL